MANGCGGLFGGDNCTWLVIILVIIFAFGGFGWGYGGAV